MCTAYVDSNLIGTGKINKAAIIGLAGGVWASSPGYTVRFVQGCVMVPVDRQFRYRVHFGIRIDATLALRGRAEGDRSCFQRS